MTFKFKAWSLKDLGGRARKAVKNGLRNGTQKLRRSQISIRAGIAVTATACILMIPAFISGPESETAEPPSPELTQDQNPQVDQATIDHAKANDADAFKPKADPDPEPVDIQYYSDLADKYAEKYGADTKWLTRVRACESGNNHLNDRNPKCKGLFQFMPSTFLANAKKINIVNPDIWSADQQTEVAAYMNSIGQSSQWTCK